MEVSPLHTLTASETSAAFITLPGQERSYTVRVQYWNALQASGSGTWSFSASVSYDKGANWHTKATGATVTLTTTGQNAEQSLQVAPNALADTSGLANDSGQIWLRVLATLGGSPSGAILAYRADLLDT
jgi:hypothetical protein